MTHEAQVDPTDRLIQHVESLRGVKRKGTVAKPAWYVDNHPHEGDVEAIESALDAAWEMQRRA